jgi:hypothetical protein
MGKKREDKPKPVEITDMMEVATIGVYMTQKLRKPTIKELNAAIREKLCAKIHMARLRRAQEGSAKAGFIAIEPRQVEGGLTETVYSMKLLSWSNPPEYAHILDLMPILMQTEQAEAIKNWFDKQEGAGAKKKKRGNVIGEYHSFRVKCILLDPILGSIMKSQYTDKVRKDFPSPVDEMELDSIFHRDELTGAYVITTDVLQGWFRTNAARYADLPKSMADYVGFKPVQIFPKNPVTQMVLPVQSERGSSHPKKHECIAAGEEFEINFVAPTKGALSPAGYEWVIVTSGLRPRRGISPARGKRFGRFLVTSFEDLGPINGNGTGQHDISYLLGDVPEVVMEQHGAYLREAVERLRLADIGKPTHEIADEVGDFPV